MAEIKSGESELNDSEIPLTELIARLYAMGVEKRPGTVKSVHHKSRGGDGGAVRKRCCKKKSAVVVRRAVRKTKNGDGGAAIGCSPSTASAGADLLKGTVDSIASSVSHMENMMHSMNRKIGHTDKAVQGMVEDMKLHGEQMKRLDRRMNKLESKMPPPGMEGKLTMSDLACASGLLGGGPCPVCPRSTSTLMGNGPCPGGSCPMCALAGGGAAGSCPYCPMCQGGVCPLQRARPTRPKRAATPAPPPKKKKIVRRIRSSSGAVAASPAASASTASASTPAP